MARGTWGGVTDYKPFAVRISWRTGTNVAQTGFHLRGALLESVDAQEVAEEVQDFVTTNFRTILGVADQVMGIDVVNMVTKEGHSISPANQLGTLGNAGQEAPEFICTTVSLKGELRTRYGQGRMFFPIRMEAHTDGPILSNLGRTALQAVIDSMATRWIGNSATGYNLINVHGPIAERAATPSSPIRPAIAPSWYDVTSLRLNTAITFLRSRKAGVGS